MSSSFPPRLDASGLFLTNGINQGTPLDWFDLSMALAPGYLEATYLRQISTALAYWQALVSSSDSLVALRASYAVTWLTAEQSKVANPPPNNFHIVYPV